MFQSTRPMRGATLRSVIFDKKLRVSIHSPHAGLDDIAALLRQPRGVSIHAPRAGRDSF